MLVGQSLLLACGPGVWPLRVMAGSSSRAILLRATLPRLLVLLLLVEAAAGMVLAQEGEVRTYGMTALILAAAIAVLVLMLDASKAASLRLDALREEHARLTAALRNRQKLEAIGKLAGGVAHEINNPLAIVENCSELIRDGVPADSAEADLAQSIQGACGRIAAIVKGLTAFSVRDEGPGSRARPRDIVDRALGIAGRPIETAGIRMCVDVEDGLPAILCRSGQVSQVVMTLLTNARDAILARGDGPHERRIDLAVGRAASGGTERIRFAVSDTGIGIPEPLRDRVFDPFFTTRDRTMRTGLGLWVAAGIVRDHGGDIFFEENGDGGARFIVELPVEGSIPAVAILADEET